MALIYAFCDEAGQWHGDPAGERYEVGQPDGATLTFDPGPGEPGAGSPFAGQTLHVLVASIGEADPGLIQFGLDDGRVRYALDEVEELLFGDDLQTAWHGGTWPPTPDRPVLARPPAAPLTPDRSPGYWQVSDGGWHYDLTATPGEDGFTVEIVGADEDGRITTRFDGHLPDLEGLALLGRLLFAVAANPDPHRGTRAGAPASRRGGAWSPEELALLARRYDDGADVDALAAELGRGVNGIRYKLCGLGRGPWPGPAAGTHPSTPRPPAQPAHTPAYTMADLRAEYPNSHMRWEPEDDQRLALRAAEGATVAELMAEFGRNEGAITSRLARVSPNRHGNASTTKSAASR